MTEEPLPTSSDDEFLDSVFDRAVELIEEGRAADADRLSAKRPHLREQVSERIDLAREIAVCGTRPDPELSGYEIVAELGRGGMGTVYLARQGRVADRLVALKVLSAAATASRHARERFLAESRTLARLRHPHVVSIHDVIDEGATLAYAMEWIDGPSLAQVIEATKRQGDGATKGGTGSVPARGIEKVSPAEPLPRGRGSDEQGESDSPPSLRRFVASSLDSPPSLDPAQIARIGIAIARALSAVHAAGLLHRDVKPSNILLRPDGTPLLSDFGIVRDVQSTMHTQEGHFIGTAAYAAPEQLRGENETIDARADVYGLGATLYHALALRLPFAPILPLPLGEGRGEGRGIGRSERHPPLPLGEAGPPACRWGEGRGAGPGGDSGVARGEDRGEGHHLALSPIEMLRQIESGRLVPLRRVKPALPRDLETIVMKAMDPDPSRRYATAADFADDLERLLNLQPIKAKPATLMTRTIKLARRNRASLLGTLVGGVVALLVSIAVAAYALVLPRWSAAELTEARLTLLDPGQGNHIFTIMFWGGGPYPGNQTAPDVLQRALHHYNAALRWQPFDGVIRREREVVEIATKRRSDEATEGRDGPGSGSRLPADLRSAGLHAFLCGAMKDALDAWTQLDLTQDPDAFVEAALGMLHLANGEPARAYPRLRDAVKAFPNVSFLSQYLADAALQCGDVDKAAQLIELAKTQPRKDVARISGLDRVTAGVLAAQGRDEEAIAVYESRSLLNPIARFQYAKFLESRGRVYEAVRIYAQVVAAVREGGRARQAFHAAMEKWWESLAYADRRVAIRSVLDGKDQQGLVALIRAYAVATERRSDEATEGEASDRATRRRSDEGKEQKYNGVRGERREEAGQDVPRLDRVAEGDGLGGVGLSGDESNAGLGKIRADVANAPGGGVGSIEHRGGSRSGEPSGLFEVPSDSPRLAHGTSNANPAVSKTGPSERGIDFDGPGSGSRPNPPSSDSLAGEKAELNPPPSSRSLPLTRSVKGRPALDAGKGQGSVAPSLFFWAFSRPDFAPYLQRDTVSLTTLIERMEVSNMTRWNCLSKLPSQVKDALTEAWLSPRPDAKGVVTVWLADTWCAIEGLKERIIDARRAAAQRSSARAKVRGSLPPSSRSLPRRAGMASLLVVAAAHGQCPPTGFTGLGDLPGGAFDSSVSEVSADGTTAVGSSTSANGTEAFRWTQVGGMVGLGDLSGGAFESIAIGVSGDGSVITGNSASSNGGREAFRWTQAGGMVGLGDLPGGGFESEGHEVSSDGSTIVGNGLVATREAFRWSQVEGMVSLGFLPGGGTGLFGSEARGVSADGSVIVGHSTSTNAPSWPPNLEAFRWTQAGGMVALGNLPGGIFFSVAADVSADGSVVVGTSSSASGPYEGFLWTQAGGMIALGDLPGGSFFSLAIELLPDASILVGSGTSAVGPEAVLWDDTLTIHRLADVLAANGVEIPCGWTLQYATDIAENCGVITIVGYGTNPNGNTEGWIASYIPGSPPVPLPDIDGDGFCNEVDNCPNVSNANQADGDTDGVGNACDNCPSVANANQANADSDGLGDACDSDDDNDGVNDGGDPASLNPSVCGDADADTCDDCVIGVDGFGPAPDGNPANDGPDADADGLCNAGDNCPTEANPLQEDCDGNGVGDVCQYCGSCQLHGDLMPQFCLIDVDDILCALDAFVGSAIVPCSTLVADIVAADFSCGPDGTIDVSDVLCVLSAFSGDYCCPPPCPAGACIGNFDNNPGTPDTCRDEVSFQGGLSEQDCCLVTSNTGLFCGEGARCGDPGCP